MKGTKFIFDCANLSSLFFSLKFCSHYFGMVAVTEMAGGTAPPRGSAAAAASLRRRRTASGGASGGAAGTISSFTQMMLQASRSLQMLCLS
ncbi:hypothetical protein PTKIN_Ptkin07bG0053100 [Pterospermum kingtungense]